MKAIWSSNILLTTSLFSLIALNTAQAAPPKAGGRPPMPPPLVVVEPVAEVSHTAVKEYIGNVEASDEVDLPSRISGIITGIKFKEGSLVKKGQLLFTIEDTTYRAKTQAAQAKLAQAEAELKYAQSNYQRQELLARQNAVSQSILEDAERLVNLNKAKCDQCSAELLDAKNDLSYTKIYAPISGRIGEVKHTFGNYVNPSSQLLAKIVSIDPIQVKFSVSERVFLDMFKSVTAPNKNLNIRIQLPNGELYEQPGKVAFIDNMIDKDTGTISIWTEFDNHDMKLMPGGYVSVLLSENLTKPLPGAKQSAIMADNH
ncbi:MAG: efflux RND transporter periplasmic adaptor subunit, partial [Victivallaceae bacterium]